MQIDTRNNELTKMRPYRTLIKNREVIDRAINEMINYRKVKVTLVIPMTIVDKKDGSKRFSVDLEKVEQNNCKIVLSITFG